MSGREGQRERERDAEREQHEREHAGHGRERERDPLSLLPKSRLGVVHVARNVSSFFWFRDWSWACASNKVALSQVNVSILVKIK